MSKISELPELTSLAEDDQVPAIDDSAATPGAKNVWFTLATLKTWLESVLAFLANPMTALGDLITGGSGGAAQRLAAGTDDQVLTMVSGEPAWADNAGLANPMTTAGDIITGGTSGAAQRLAAGTDDQILTMVSGEPAWAAAASGFSNPMTTAGDLITGGTSGAAQRLAAGTDGHVLKLVSGTPAWAAESGSGGGSDYIHWDTARDDMHGAAANTLDAIATTGLSAGYMQAIDDPYSSASAYGGLRTYELVAGTLTAKTITAVSTPSDYFTCSSHGLVQGDTIQIRSTGDLPGGVTANQVYWVKWLSSSTFSISTTKAYADAGTKVDLTTAGSGTISLVKVAIPYQVIPADYDASTNAKYWVLREPEGIWNYHDWLEDPATEIVTTGTYELFCAPCDMRVELVMFGNSAQQGGAMSAMFQVNVVSGLYSYLSTTTNDSRFGAYGRADKPTQIKANLLHLHTGDRVHLYLSDTGFGSGDYNFGLFAHVIGRPLKLWNHNT